MTFNYDTPLLKDENSSLMWYYLIHVPATYAEQLNKPDRRVICVLNGEKKIHAALMPNGEGSYYIIINKEVRKKLGLGVGSKVNVALEKDTSPYGIAAPEVFLELCEQDPEGSKVFHELTPGKQRSLLYVIGKPKSETKQMEKAFVVLDYLKSVNGKLDFKELNEAFKNNRFKL